MSDQTVVRFIQNGEEPSEIITKTFEEAQEAGYNCEWMQEEDCMQISQRVRKSVFIFDTPEGQAFENVAKHGNRIYGPIAMLFCMRNEQNLPNKQHPVFSLAMMGTTVSCTSVEKDKREKLHEMVQWMCGDVSKDFHMHVTHLIAGEVGSKKYMVAASLKKKIMSPEWVEKMWDSSKTQFVTGSDSCWEKYRCPVFKGFVVTVSGLDSQERADVRQTIEKEGGRYSGEMKINECTHLVLHQPKGQKYEFAKKWKIHIVTPKWVFESVEEGFCQEEQKYKVENLPQVAPTEKENTTSTPTKGSERARLTSLPNVSVISVTHINDTAMTTANVTAINAPNQTALNQTALQQTAMNQTAVNPGAHQTRHSVFEEEENPLDNLDLSGAKGLMFLDGCKIFLSGFTGPQENKLRRIINLGGGTRFNQINESVSHVVVGRHIDDHIKQLREAPFRPQIVKVGWLVESFRKRRQISEEDYCCPELLPPDPVSPLIGRKKSLQSRLHASNAETPPQPPPPQVDHDAMQEVLSQYLPQQQTADFTDESALIRAVEAGEAAAAQRQHSTSDPDKTKTDNDKTLQDDDADATQDPNMQSREENPLFEGKTFVILGYMAEEENELQGLIEDMMGKVLPANTRRVPDYAVVSVFGYQVDMTVGEIVTNSWLQMCIESDMLLPVESNPIFTPLTIKPDCYPLKGCVLSISGFTGTERDTLMHVAESLGAACQEYFVKRANRNLEPSTHLIVAAPEGSKYAAAKKWNLPAVTKNWLFASGRTGRKQPEERYLVDNTEPDPDHSELERSVETSHHTNISLPAAASVAMETDEQADMTAGQSDRSVKDVPQENMNTSQSTSRTPSVPRSTPSKEIDIENKSLTTFKTPQNFNNLDKSNKENSLSHQRKRNIILSTESNSSVKDASEGKILLNNRVKELIQADHESPKPPNTTAKDGIETPGKFLDPNKIYRPKFDLTDALEALASPINPEGKKKKRESLPLDEMYSKQIAIAIQNSAQAPSNTDMAFQQSQEPGNSNSGLLIEQPHGPLVGVVIGVSKKLSSKQSEYNNIAASLGADYRWTYDRSCTHFIFQGRNNDLNKEFRVAKEQSKIIVSPHWLLMCQEQNARVEESLFPHTFNPNMSLSLSRNETPARPTRRSRRLIPSTKDDATSAASPIPRTRRAKVSPPQEDEPPKKVPVPVETNKKDDLDQTQSDEEMAKACEELEENKQESGDSLVSNLKNIMAVTRTYSKGRRRSRRYGSSEMSGMADDSTEGRTSRPSSRQGKKDKKAVPMETQVEASQAPVISWDDPTAREQREKLASELAKDSESFSPGPHLQSDEDPTLSDDDIRRHILSPKPDHSKLQVPQQMQDVPEERIPTPEPPSLAFPLPKVSVTKEKPQEVELIPEDGDPDETMDEGAQENLEPPKPVFLFSGMAQQERDDYGALVEQFGGQLSDAAGFDARCTHLVTGNPSRNEKYLACVAAGKWVLHKSYFEACREQNSFVEELLYEWGGEGTESLVSSSNSMKSLARSAHRWRLKLEEIRREKPGCTGAFEGWKVVLLTDKRREDGFRRLLEAGGATVVSTRYPVDGLEDVTHAFMDLAKAGVSVDLEVFVNAGVHCVKPEYIASYLMDDPAPKPKQFYIPELQHLNKMDRKRKPSEPLTPNSKRSRRK